MIHRLPARPRRWLMMLALLAALPLPSAAARPSQQMPDFSGCRSVQGDAWFVDALSFEPLAIAPGVLVEPLDDGVRLSNTTETPLYLVEVFSDDTFYAPTAPISLPAPLGVRQRVLAGKVATWYAADGNSAPQWNTEEDIKSLDYSGSLPEMWLRGFKQDLHYADDRPANVVLPPAATYTLRVIYGDELIAIPVTQTYRLNPNYDPNEERIERERCENGGPNFFALAALCIGVPIGVLVALSLGVICIIDRRYG